MRLQILIVILTTAIHCSSSIADTEQRALIVYGRCGITLNVVTGEMGHLPFSGFDDCMNDLRARNKIVEKQTQIIKAKTMIITSQINSSHRTASRKSLKNYVQAISEKEEACKEYFHQIASFNAAKQKSGYFWFLNFVCLKDCSGHEEGYRWAKERGEEYNSCDKIDSAHRSFIQGCQTYYDEIERARFEKEYQKAGIVLMNLTDSANQQASLFGAHRDNDRLMAVMDRVNALWGRGTLRSAATGMARSWSMRREKMSPQFTTHWEQLPVAVCNPT